MADEIAKATREDGFRNKVELRSHELTSDEPEARGGTDAGPSPTDLLAAALASCTSITMQMYADRKGWDLPSLGASVEVEGSPIEGDATYTVVLHLPGGLTEDQTQRLTRIAGRCPVHRALARETDVSIANRVEG